MAGVLRPQAARAIGTLGTYESDFVVKLPRGTTHVVIEDLGRVVGAWRFVQLADKVLVPLQPVRVRERDARLSGRAGCRYTRGVELAWWVCA